MSLIFSYPEPEVKILACKVMTEATANNKKVQEFVQRSGALNLTIHVDKESDPAVKEAVFNSLSSYLKGDNFEGKRLFIKDYDGL